MIYILHSLLTEKSWFETGGVAAGAGVSGPEPAAATPVAPSAAAPAPAHHACALCGDAFQQFYNEDKEEWHLRNSVKHEEDYYHPQCFEDYKVSFWENVSILRLLINLKFIRLLI